jgi:hypothetical protein
MKDRGCSNDLTNLMIHCNIKHADKKLDELKMQS